MKAKPVEFNKKFVDSDWSLDFTMQSHSNMNINSIRLGVWRSDDGGLYRRNTVMGWAESAEFGQLGRR